MNMSHCNVFCDGGWRMMLMKNSPHSFHLRLLDQKKKKSIPFLCVFLSEKCFWHEVIKSFCDLLL